MSEHLPVLLVAILAAVAYWYSRHRGHLEGYTKGYAEGHAMGHLAGRAEALAESAGTACPSGVGGPGPVPR